MIKQKIELLAVSKLKYLLSRLDYVIPEINDNDKSPSWDGFIFLYNKKDSDSKKYLEKRIPIQVKGHYSKEPYQDSISFSAETSDLINYLKENGVIYFVVYVDEDENSQIYYAKLSRFIIRRLLRGKENQSFINLHLDKLPNKKEDIIDIFFNFTLDMNLSFPEKDISIKDVIKGNSVQLGFDTFFLSYKSIQKQNNCIDVFLDKKPTLCLKNNFTGITIPIESNYDLAILSTENLSISIDKFKYYEKLERIRKSNNRVILKFGKSFSFDLIVTESQIAGKFNFKIKGSLNERINDTKFIIEFLTKFRISFGDKTINIPTDNPSKHKADLQYFKKNLALLENIKKLLDVLKVEEDLDYDNVSEYDEKNLILLINTILYGKEYKRSNSETGILYKISISNIKLLLVVLEKDVGHCHIYNFFDEKNYITCAFSFENNDEKFIIPNSFILREDDFASIDNIDFDKIYNDIVNSEKTNNMNEYLFSFMLEMLMGYKKRTKVKEKYLECIKKSINCLSSLKSDLDFNELLKQIDFKF